MKQQLTPPAVEPIPLSVAKSYLRVDHADEDALIELLITAVRMKAEGLTGRALITQDWRITLDGFPFEAIDLALSPVQSVIQLSYTDRDGVDQLMASAGYKLLAADVAPLLYPVDVWPDTASAPDAVRIDVRCGYGAAGDAVPAPIRSWMLLRLAGAYESRNSVVTGASVVELPHSHLDGLLDQYRILRVA